jgi:hypothetical protein
MAGLGWTGTSPYGLQSTLRQQVMDRIQQEQQGFNNDIQTRELALREQQAKAQEEDRQAVLAEHTQGLRDQTAAKAIPLPGENIAPDDYARTYAGTSSAHLFNPQVSLPATQTAGAMPLDAGQPSAATTTAAPQRLTGRMVSEGTPEMQTQQEQKVMRGRLLADPSLTPDKRLALTAEGAGLKVPSNFWEPKPPSHLVPVDQGGKGVYMNEADAAGQPVFEKPEKAPKDPTPHFQLQPEVDPATGKQTGRFLGFNTLTNSWEPVKGDGPTGTKAAPGAAQTSRQETLAGFAGEDIDSALSQIDAAQKAGLLGPVNGRVIGQFLGGTVGSTGNPDTDKQLGGLRGAIATLKQSYPPAISGSVRGAGAGDKLKTVLDTDKFSSDMLRGALTDMKAATTRRTPGGGGMIEATDPQGNIHHAPAGTALPAGWKLVSK